MGIEVLFGLVHMKTGDKNRFVVKYILGEWSWKRVLHSVPFVLVLVYGFAVLYAAVFADSIIFRPKPASYTHQAPFFHLRGRRGEKLTVRWFSNPAARYTVLYSHGNAEDLGDLGGIPEAFQMHGYSVIAYDYSGYGTSTGKPTEQTVYENILTVYEYLRFQRKLEPGQILVFGRSVGGGPCVELAAHHPVGGLILESVFSSAFRVVTGIPVFPFDKFDNIKKISAVSCPVLVMHGRQDEVIPFSHGQAVYEKARFPKMKLWVASGGHNDIMRTAGFAYWEAVDRLVRLADAGSRDPYQGNKIGDAGRNPICSARF
jgi:pimeloyl-ACP methyl ester carboxylesterase